MGTSTRERPGKSIAYRELQILIEKRHDRSCSSSNGLKDLSDEVVERCEKMLIPIRGKGNYNHLSLTGRSWHNSIDYLAKEEDMMNEMIDLLEKEHMRLDLIETSVAIT